MKHNTIRFEVAFQIVATDVKRISRRHTEQPVECLRLHFNIFKLALRLGITPIRAIPVAEINQLTARFSGNTPVRNLMNCAGIKAVGKDNSVIRYFRISRKIDRFVVAFNQTGIKFIGKAAIKNFNQLLIVVCTVH
ncbi:Uncharacterised protein [Shigella sonnei]|nr:Uncharacterised protein [Shigella sonnei]